MSTPVFDTYEYATIMAELERVHDTERRRLAPLLMAQWEDMKEELREFQSALQRALTESSHERAEEYGRRAAEMLSTRLMGRYAVLREQVARLDMMVHTPITVKMP